MPRTRLVLLCACVIVASPLRAQATADSTTATFRPGQWGVEFLPGSQITEAGVLRFATHTHAWALDGSASLDWQDVSGTSPSSGNGNSHSISARLGPRWYHAVSANVARFIGLGISASYARNEFSTNASRSQLWSAGAFGELGMQYMFTRHFSLGFRGSVLASRSESRSTSAADTQQITSYVLALRPVHVTGTIYF